MSRSTDTTGPEIRFAPALGPLMPLVESYYLCRWDRPDIAGVDRVDMGQMRFMLKGGGSVTFADGRVERTFPVTVNAPGSAAASYRMDGPLECFGVSLRAIGWRGLVGLPVHLVADRLLDGAALFGPEIELLLARLRRLDTLEAMIAEVEPFLIARRRPVPRAHLELARAAREWAAAAEEPQIEALYAAVPLSRRQVTRLCNEYFGGSPVHLKRKFRAIRAAIRLYRGEDPADVAGAFSDQSHMIKEVRHFTGQTPMTLRERIDPVLAMTLDNETFHFLPEVLPEAVDLDGG